MARKPWHKCGLSAVPWSRAIAVHARTMEVLRQMGCVDALIAKGQKLHGVTLWSSSLGAFFYVIVGAHAVHAGHAACTGASSPDVLACVDGVAITRARKRCTILHAANRRIYGQWTSSIPSRFVGELPPEHTDSDTTMSGGESLWRANWSERADPFANVARGSSRGPGWQRAQTSGQFSREPVRIVEARTSAVSLGNKGRDDVSVGQRVFHQKFGYGTVKAADDDKLDIVFDKAGDKRLLDRFVELA